MQAWESIQKTMDYMEENLEKEIRIKELADVAGLSPFYFQRLFAQLVKKPAGEYLRLRRLARAAAEVKAGNTRILDTALRFGFSGHSSFTRAFREAYGVTPEEYRSGKIHLNQFVKPDLVLNYVMAEENVPVIADNIVITVKRRKLESPCTFAGIAGEIPLEELMGGTSTGISLAGKLWDEFHLAKPQIPGLLPGGNEFGALYIGNAKEGCCTYMAGAESECEKTAERYAVFELPAAEYIVCGFEAESFEELTTSAVYKVQTFMGQWMKKHQLTTTDFAGEMYYPAMDGIFYMEHWLIPVPLES